VSQVKSKQKIAVFFGGRSPEHDVSVVTGLQVMGAVDTSVYDVMAVYIAPDGEWLCARQFCGIAQNIY
jgi:D-alanine-D-alanine ligase